MAASLQEVIPSFMRCIVNEHTAAYYGVTAHQMFACANWHFEKSEKAEKAKDWDTCRRHTLIADWLANSAQAMLDAEDRRRAP
jgi:hypothetical protein